MAKIKCDCIFCSFKCPECGAEEIEITYSPVFTCRNDINDRIMINRSTDKMELKCEECGAWLEYNDYSNESEKLEVLRKALSETIGIPKTTFFWTSGRWKSNSTTQVVNVSKERRD